MRRTLSDQTINNILIFDFSDFSPGHKGTDPFNLRWHKASLSEEDSSLFKWRQHFYSKREIIVKKWKYIDKIKISSSPQSLGRFQLYMAQSTLGWRGFKSVTKGPSPFPRGDNNKIVIIDWGDLKIFSRTTGPISSKLGTKHSWVKGFQVCSNEGSSFFLL